jgi:hypothetical protein
MAAAAFNQMSSCRRETRSTQTPAKSPIATLGTLLSARINPICPGVTRSVTAATIGSAKEVRLSPRPETASPSQ